MKVRENPYVTQLAIARPNPYQPISSPNIKEGRDMLRKNAAIELNSNSGRSSSSISSADAMQKRRNLQAAIAAIESNVKSNPRPSSFGNDYVLEEDVELFTNPRKRKAKKSVSAKKASPKKAVKRTAKKNPVAVRSNPPRRAKKATEGIRIQARDVDVKKKDTSGKDIDTTVRRGRSRALASGRGQKKSMLLPTKIEGDRKHQILDTSKVTDIAKQVRILKREYAVSKSPVTKKKLDRALKTLDQMSTLVEKDLNRLEKASAILKENPKKGGTMAKKAKRSTSRRKTSSSIFSKLMTKVKAKKKATSSKRKARKNPGIKALGSAIVGIENPRKRKTKSSPRKMSRAVMSALSDFSPTHVVVTRNGKSHKIKAQVTSAEYKAAKAKGLTGRFASLKGKKNAHDCLSVRSVKSLSGSTASLAEIQKALNAWAGAHAGHKLHAKANPKKRAIKRSATTITRRKRTVKGATKRRKARRNPIQALGASIVGIDNPRKRKRKSKASANTFTTKRSRKTAKRRKSRKAAVAVVHTRRRKSRKPAASKTIRHNGRKAVRRTSRKRVASKKKSTAKKHRKTSTRRRTRRNPVESLSLMPMGYALMHNNPAAGMHGIHHRMRHNPEISTGAKLGYGVLGASLFLTGSNMIGGLVQDKLISKEVKADTKSNTPMIAEVLTHAALGGVAYGVYRAAPQDESIKSFAVGSALGVIGSLLARTVVKDTIANSFLGGFFRATGGQGEFLEKAKVADDAAQAAQPATSGYGRYIETPVSGYVPDHATVGAYISKPVVGSYITKPVHGYVPDHPTVGKFIAENPLETLSGFGRYIETETAQPQVASSALEGMNMRHLHGLGVLRDTDMGTQVLSSKNAPQDLTRAGGRGFDLAQLSQELRDVDSLSFEELRAEGVPEVNLETVAVIRATPYYARQIVESNLGYMMSESVVVPGSYLVGLFVGPDSMMYNTGIGARNLSIPHGVRSARPAGIFTHTVFSSILPTADGQPIWAGGDDGDF